MTCNSDYDFDYGDDYDFDFRLRRRQSYPSTINVNSHVHKHSLHTSKLPQTRLARFEASGFKLKNDCSYTVCSLVAGKYM